MNAQQKVILNDQQKQVNLTDIIDIIIRRWWIVVVSIVICAFLAYGISRFFIEPTYVSKGSLYVASSESTRLSGTVNAGEITTSARLALTYIEILKSETYLKKVAAESGLNYTAGRIKDMLTLSSANETEILLVEIKCNNKEHATILTQTILNNAEAELVRIVKAGSVEIIDNASVPTSPSSPNTRVNTLVGILIGMALGVLIIFLLELMDVRVKSEDELGARYNLPVLGIIPDLKGGSK